MQKRMKIVMLMSDGRERIKNLDEMKKVFVVGSEVLRLP